MYSPVHPPPITNYIYSEENERLQRVCVIIFGGAGADVTHTTGNGTTRGGAWGVEKHQALNRIQHTQHSTAPPHFTSVRLLCSSQLMYCGRLIFHISCRCTACRRTHTVQVIFTYRCSRGMGDDAARTRANVNAANHKTVKRISVLFN